MPGLKFIGWQQSEREHKANGTFTLDRRLYLNADKSKVVEDGDPEAAFLLGAKGAEMPLWEAIELGLAEKPAPAEPAEAKAAIKPADKAVRKHEDKGR